MHTQTLSVAAAVALLMAGCSDTNGTRGDSAASADRGRGDLTLDRKVAGEASATDRGSSAEASRGDRGAADRTGADQRSLDVTVAKDKGGSADSGACAGATCSVVNDCCLCRAIDTAKTPPPRCAITGCKQPTCGAMYLKQPGTYCLNGLCFLADVGTSCTGDSDCKKVNDCCECTALPKGASPAPCSISCLVPHCTAIGMSATGAACINKVCRLTF